jgi:hypothetical protein
MKDAILKAIPTVEAPADGMGGHHTVGRPLKKRVEAPFRVKKYVKFAPGCQQETGRGDLAMGQERS